MAISTPIIQRGIIQSFDSATWTAVVQMLPSVGNYLATVQVAKDLAAAEISAGDYCAILFFDELNPADAVIIAVYHVPSAAPPTGSGGPALSFARLASPLSFNDASNHPLASVTFSIASGQKAKVTYSVNLKYGSVGAGLHVFVQESSTTVVPGSGNSDCIVRQTAESELFTYCDVLQPSAGSHTYDLKCNAAVAVAAATVYAATLVVEVY